MTIVNDTELEEKEQFNAYKAIEAALTPYIDGAKAGDAQRIRGAFTDDASMAGTLGGQFSQVHVDSFLEFEANLHRI